MARRASAARKRREVARGAPASPHVRRVLPVFDPLDPDQVARLEAQVDWILEAVGVAFRDDPEAIRIAIRWGRFRLPAKQHPFWPKAMWCGWIILRR